MSSRLLKQLFGFLLTFFVAGATPGWAQSKVNFKVIPILQPMKEVAPTPEFSLASPEGKKISLKDFRGKTLFLNFWATWCEPCREEMPSMEHLHQTYKDRGLAVIAISLDSQGASMVNPFVKKFGLSFPMGLDPKIAVRKT